VAYLIPEYDTENFATILAICFMVTAVTYSRWFLALGFFYPEDGGDTFL
jgi:hypothetical protein